MVQPFLLASGFFWTVTYILIIRRGYLDKGYGMPLAALGANIAWEFIFAFILPHPYPQRAVNMVWFALDFVILLTVLRNGPREFPDWSPRLFYGAFLITLVTAAALVYLVSIEFQDMEGAYAAYGQNLMMSVLFIDMLRQRRSVRGQSVYIALAKLLGTLVVSIGFFFFVPSLSHSVLFPFLYVAVFAFDAIYVVMLYRQTIHEGIDPWRRA